MVRRLAALLVLSVAVAGCGQDGTGSGAGGDPRKLLADAFDNEVVRATVDMKLELRLEGGDLLKGPFRLTLKGPYADNGDRLPSFDWDVAVAQSGFGLSGGLVSTGDNVWVRFRGESYEVGEELVAQLNRYLEREAGRERHGTLRSLGIDASRWIRTPELAGGGEVGGAEVTKVSGDVDVVRVVEDFLSVSSGAFDLGPAERRDIERAVEKAEAEVYVADEDHTMRRLRLEVEFDVPESRRAALGGLEAGRLVFDSSTTDVGEKQEIHAPKDAKPLDELLGELGLGGDIFEIQRQ
jgi:hypothetical protein